MPWQRFRSFVEILLFLNSSAHLEIVSYSILYKKASLKDKMQAFVFFSDSILVAVDCVASMDTHSCPLPPISNLEKGRVAVLPESSI